MASNRLWGHHLPEQLTGPAVDRQLRLQLRDPPASGSQFGVLGAAGSRQTAGVDQVLPPPDVDDLLTDPEVRRDLRDRPAGLDQIDHLATKLGRVAPRHDVPFGSLDG
jgi:hypothetical protein